LKTTINAEPAEIAETTLFCVFSKFCVERRLAADLKVRTT
jgi:hypothetical protein